MTPKRPGPLAAMPPDEAAKLIMESEKENAEEWAKIIPPLSTFARYKYNNIRNRLADLQIKYGINDTARQILQNEIEAAALYWFLEAGGNKEDFETKFNTGK